VSGRALSEVDVVESRRVAVVNQTAVARYFGSANPIGRAIKLSLLQLIEHASNYLVFKGPATL